MTIPYTDALVDDMLTREMAGFSNNPESPNEQVAPNPQDRTKKPSKDDLSAMQRALYGADYPGADPATELKKAHEQFRPILERSEKA